tara:strand:- start:250 stop:528 length:279 start_codon:yes stop_codon:yes gene_type:complete
MNRRTSRISYKDLIETGRQGTQVKSILKLLSTGESLSRREIADVVRLETSSVAGRVNTLIKMGIVQENKMRKCLISKKLVKPVSIIGVYNGE